MIEDMSTDQNKMPVIGKPFDLASMSCQWMLAAIEVIIVVIKL